MVRLSPPERLGEFFGLYGLVGKGSQVIGPLLYGLIVFLFLDTLGDGAYQIAVLSLLVTMLIGLWLVVAGPRRLVGQRRESRPRHAAAARAPRPGGRAARAARPLTARAGQRSSRR